MHILVTGGAGFIGSNLCDYLVDKGYKVSVVDDLSSGKISNLSSVINNINFYQEKVETFDFNKLSNVSSVVHLAAQVSVHVSISSFETSSTSNLSSAIKVIDYCRLNNVPLVYASSAAVYGNLELGNDLNSEIDLLSPYAADKYMLEIYNKTAFRSYQLASIGLRFFNVYGPRQDPSNAYSGVISIFADRLLRSDKITINGGHQTRDFIYIKDVIEVIFKSIVLLSNSIICEQVNVLTGSAISIDDLAILMMKKVDTEVEKIYGLLPNGDPEGSSGTTRKMEKLFKIELNNMTNIDNGISETLIYIKDELDSKLVNKSN
jgi:UDP-glucose 4-epimerase